MNQKTTPWAYIALYCVVAFTVSLSFHLKALSQALHWQEHMAPAWQGWLFAPAALGPLLGALLCYKLDRRTPRRISLLGQDRVASALTAIIPLVAFTVAGLTSPGHSRVPGEALVLALSPILAVVYALGEELGWRGYLQDALAGLTSTHRYLIAGVLWWAWHGRFHNPFELTVFLPIVVVSAFLLGRAAEETRSLLVVASMHATIILLTKNGAVSSAYYIAGAVTILGWILIRRFRPALPVQASSTTS